jgi:hypothetical protein
LTPYPNFWLHHCIYGKTQNNFFGWSNLQIISYAIKMK